MFFSPKSVSTLALAALLASPAFAQQTTTKTFKSSERGDFGCLGEVLAEEETLLLLPPPIG